MKPVVKKILKGAGATLAVLGLGFGAFIGLNVRAFDQSMEKAYDMPPLPIGRSQDPQVIARGEHLARGLGGCSSKDCHGSDFGGGKPLVMGPVGTFSGPNLTTTLPAYSDGELARLVRFGIKKDNRSVRFMPVEDFSWMNDGDVRALISYLRTVKAVDRPNGVVTVGVLGKMLDRKDAFPIDVARRSTASPPVLAGPPEPTAAYGALLAHGCTGCHGRGFSGGPIPGAPKETPVPLNLTPHESGLAGWTYEDFDKLMKKGIRKNGKTLDPFMPIDNYGTMDETEQRALFAYLTSIPSKPFGGR